ncbi:cobinamide kinase [Porphyromonas canoris]|nr:cobinamide kinase [Porphyromonas canoris]KGN67437.1 cobinamide kinase [Porphyromonas sp. COT-108 OH1349]
MMRKIIYISGGQRSGKSSFAQQTAELLSPYPVYLATAHVWDDDFRERIRRHQQDRGPHWTNIEEEIEISKHDLSGKVVLLDCVTLWLTNIYHANGYALQSSLEQAKEEWNKFIEQQFTLIVVSNEIGMGLHAPDQSSRHFTDLQGWINQYIAGLADEAYCMISGIPLRLK